MLAYDRLPMVPICAALSLTGRRSVGAAAWATPKAGRILTIPRFITKKCCLELVFATLSRASQRWQGVMMSEIERQQLGLIRHELGLLDDEHTTAVHMAGRLTA